MLSFISFLVEFALIMKWGKEKKSPINCFKQRISYKVKHQMMKKKSFPTFFIVIENIEYENDVKIVNLNLSSKIKIIWNFKTSCFEEYITSS